MVQVREQASTVVLSDHMELLRVGIQVSVELLRILRLDIVLLLLVDDILELIVARRAVSLSRVGVNALVVESVSAHEMNSGQSQAFVAGVALLWVEVLGRGL